MMHRPVRGLQLGTAVLHILRVWQNATSMKENATKRELLLLGKLRGHPERLPANLVAGGVTPAADGETIRALGVPVGNDFDLEAWWLGRYTTVKTRIGAWNGLARLSLTGRNILLQSILYGSLRYWFFTLLVPNSMVHAAAAAGANVTLLCLLMWDWR